MNYRAEIDGLRAIAVLSVVFFHAFPSALSGGFIGVDIFFVISGYLISRIIFENLEQGRFCFLDFYSRRIRRIFPALTVVMASVLVFGGFVLLSDEYMQVAKHTYSAAVFLVNFVLVNESGYFDNIAETKPLLHLWSLAVEEQFYLIWPLIVWGAWKARVNLLLVTILIAVSSFLWSIYFIESNPTETFFWPFGRFWELLAGGALAWFSLYKPELIEMFKGRLSQVLHNFTLGKFRSSKDALASNLMSSAGVILLFLGFLLMHKNLLFPGTWAIVPVLGTVLVIVAGEQSWLNRTLLANRVSVWFGLISYPLYLWHWPILSFMRIIEGSTPSTTSCILAVVLSIGLAWLTFKLIERPLRFKVKSNNAVAVLVLTLTLIGGAGVFIKLKEGLPERASLTPYTNNLNELKRTAGINKACLEYLGLSSIKFNYCRLSNINGKGTAAVIGDSHAHVAYPGIAKGMKEFGLDTILLANSGCPPFLGAPSGRTQNEKKNCTERTEQILENVAKIENLKVVYLFSRGPIYWTGSEPASEEVLTPSLNFDNYFSGLQRTVDYLQENSIPVVYIIENPELEHTARACIPRPLNNTSKERCETPLTSIHERQALYRKELSEINNLVVLDSIHAFCDESKNMCSALNEKGELLYADDDHISVMGSETQYEKVILPYVRNNLAL